GRTLVLGDGGWGTALALALHRSNCEVAVWGYDNDYAKEVATTRSNPKFLPGVEIPADIVWTGDYDECLEGVEEVYSVIPTQFLRGVLRSFRGRFDDCSFVSATKGLEIDTLQRPSEILVEEAGAQESLVVLSGPSHAEEVAKGMATSLVAASKCEAAAQRVQDRISGPEFRIYTSTDVSGVELGGALKNIIAVAAGVAEGLGLGDNARAALVTRGLVEMARFSVAQGAERETFSGLSGVGDLMVTCWSPHSRNRSLGFRIGSGESLDEILASEEKVAEGVWTCRAVHQAASEQNLELPITARLFSILFEREDPRASVVELMSRPFKSERDPNPC
ncbi:MAG TPA: glycerol-3-phosphate dehydrogenase, partial [Planctomycetes bacterium]|nr:glycerol-3-phosphate dehydrogenase [Planctomycetota bacterium]